MDTNFHEFISLPGKRHSCRFSETFFKEISFGGISASDWKVASPKRPRGSQIADSAAGTPWRGGTNITPCAPRSARLGKVRPHRPRLKGATARSIRRRAASRPCNRSCAFQARVPFVPQPPSGARRMGLFLFRISCGSVAQADGRQRESALSAGTLLEKRIPTAPRKFRERKFLPRMSADAFAGTLPRETTSRRGRRRGRASARRRRRDRSGARPARASRRAARESPPPRARTSRSPGAAAKATTRPRPSRSNCSARLREFLDF